MFTSIVFTAVLASSSALLSHAIVTPNEPGPGDVFNQGTTCHIGWAGDSGSGSTTAWKNMAIELMTGPNEAMVHITTVATGQDGTVAGTFDYTCPEVTPNSPIYFYQFTSGGTSNFTWTGRFTIAAADGSSTPATETEQSNGQTVSYGTGALVDPSTAVAAPTFNSSSSGSASGAASSSASAGGSSAAASTSAKASITRSAATTPLASASSSGSAASPSGSNAAMAMGSMVDGMHMWQAVVALTASAMAFTILL
ncbi:hypothetical protein B0H10DRAFT_2161982 [Mycena sp. CBHHK59/15]|nr:hypothetical protein B0H10DRAFT_2178680 [Mycena sp. CBHHK59/15]KAJ6624828.1 hypothetical protein B0H10DRAFT_2161982 [Mycena sp. CBHHK59/15]